MCIVRLMCARLPRLSFTGTITFKNARKAPEVIAAVPLDRIMVETDAPYMAPTPYRGKRCSSYPVPPLGICLCLHYNNVLLFVQ